MKLTHATLLFVCLSACTIHAQTLDLPLITINETETTYAQVDEIHFSLTIRTHAKEIENARAKNKEIATSVFSFLDKKKIPKRYVQTKRMTVGRNYIRNSRSGEYDGFNAYQQIYVCLTDIDSYDEITDALLQMEIASLNGPIFKSSKYEETLKSARLEALKKARISAVEMSNALGQKIGKAKLVKTSVTRSNNSAYSSQNNSNVNAQGSQSSFEIGEIEIVATVEVSFELLE